MSEQHPDEAVPSVPSAMGRPVRRPGPRAENAPPSPQDGATQGDARPRAPTPGQRGARAGSRAGCSVLGLPRGALTGPAP